MPCLCKLIEVSLPLEAINAVSAREKSIRRGPSIRLQQIQFDINGGSCYKLVTSPLLLRGQGARRLITASAFLILSERSVSQGER